ncbi:uncharacterized protein LOC142328886 isoform X2 [Lycorma delicatula]|uniref:uncharacterized protein LOC142328886 isoform X2 n=1 Tax=Lycorma delicatula TaxID=130591 RepID=UPI003F50EF92
MIGCWLSPASSPTDYYYRNYGNGPFYSYNGTTDQHLQVQPRQVFPPEYPNHPIDNHHHHHHSGVPDAINHQPLSYNYHHRRNDFNDGSGMDNSVSCSSRNMRNRAEKKRRDNLNSCISELAALVPMVSSSPKRVDKTSILRLAVTYLRINNILIPGTDRHIALPNLLENLDFAKFVLDELGSIMLVVTSTGKIVFVPHTVEQVLGYPQIELLGESLFKITCLEDHDELRKNLRPDENEISENACSTSDGAGEDTSSSESSVIIGQSPSPGTTATSSISGSSETAAHQRYRRSFYLRLMQRAASRNDKPQYELVHIVGHLRVPQKQKISKKTHKGAKDQLISNNEVLLVAMMKPYKEKRIADLSLLESTREEYITRHLVDGTIIYTDHRISVVTGYMAEEVTGIHGFNYMHKDDVRWTMIALRQMYYRGESYGSSCYRLMTKTGNFIYLRTYGYLELGEDNETVQSFVCINSLVSEEEGEELIRKMKNLFSPLVTERTEPGINAIARNHIQLPDVIEGADSGYSSGELEDPRELQCAITHLVSSLPANHTVNHKPCSPSPLPESPQYFKLAWLASKSFPPVVKQSSKFKITFSTLRTGEEQQPQQQETTKSAQAERQSVIRRTTRNRNSESSDTEVTDVKRMKTSDESSVHVDVESKASQHVGVVVTHQIDVKHHHVKLIVPNSQAYPDSPHNPAPPPSIPPPPSQVVPLIPAPQHLSVDCSCTTSLVEPSLSPTVSIFEQSEDFICEFMSSLENPATPTQMDFRPLSLATEPMSEDLTQETELNHVWGGSIERNHRQLESRMQYQKTQITKIKEDLQTVDNINNQLYISNFTKLKAQQQELSCCYKEHKEQCQELRTLQQDALSIQQNITRNVPRYNVNDI